ncbi:CDP-alcohol phosphatidyltransferase family protein [Marivita hallyeonensis]|uniref:Phosphatidylglycerophosphate synthase n=1 Tax=Marivita hallyeonensis TaxID=996342 RepID=A0A1M5S7J5_9RHOB|nr:CDP-alcohol phosphatidyltransferase family protein [Marivita hallyeonensis]SHH34425.1 Phosphatidylglycerophosphate synthase [Marivita hallyeonensis]
MKDIATPDARIEANGPVRFGLRRPVAAFCLAGLVGVAVIFLASDILLGLGAAWSSVVLVSAAFLGAVGIGAVTLHRTYPHDRLGLCNLITLARLAIVSVLGVALLEAKSPDLMLLLLAVLSLCLDGADGWLARRQNLASSFGARFDVEVDAAFALLLAIYTARVGVASPYVILLGLPYYAFRIALAVFPWLNAPLPERFSRKAVCVAQIAVLIVLLVPGVPGSVTNAMVLTVIGALMWSFGRDIVWLNRNRT